MKYTLDVSRCAKKDSKSWQLAKALGYRIPLKKGEHQLFFDIDEERLNVEAMIIHEEMKKSYNHIPIGMSFDSIKKGAILIFEG